jgi:hypothetical protein
VTLVHHSRVLRSLFLAIVAAGACTAIVGAQSELVIHKDGSTQYHRPGCEVIRDGKDVLALTRAQAEARGYRPHPDCDPQQRQSGAPSAGSPAPAAKPETVYVNGTKYYHRKDCRKLEANAKAVRAETLDIAGKTYWPCPDCRPPVRKRNPASEPLGRVR